MNYFSEDELACKCCGRYRFDEDFLGILNSIRSDCGFPLPVSSGYRCVNHPIEAKKASPGPHTTGKAVDIAVSHDRARTLIKVALEHGVPRIGINQKGSGRFIHLDWVDFPTVWSY